MPYLLHGNVLLGELKNGAHTSPSCLTEEREMAAPISKHNSRDRGCGEAPSRCPWREGQQCLGRAVCQLHTKQPSGQLRHLCDFSWMRTSGEESPWKGLTEAFIRSIHQLQYFKTGFYLCTRPGFTRSNLSVDNYWQHCTLLNTSTEVIQTMHCTAQGSPHHTTPSNSCL